MIKGIFIGNQDIELMDLHSYRKKLSIIPQIPVIFPDTIKFNIDPEAKYSEQEIIKVLQEVRLWDIVKSMPKGLLTEINDSDSSFSVG